MSQSPFEAALELVTHVPGVRGAMLVMGTSLGRERARLTR